MHTDRAAHIAKKDCTWTCSNLASIDDLIQNGPHGNVQSVHLELVEPSIRHVAAKQAIN